MQLDDSLSEMEANYDSEVGFICILLARRKEVGALLFSPINMKYFRKMLISMNIMRATTTAMTTMTMRSVKMKVIL